MENRKTKLVEGASMKVYLKGDFIKVNSEHYIDKSAIVLRDVFLTDTHCSVLIDGSPQYVHTLDCTICLELSA